MRKILISLIVILLSANPLFAGVPVPGDKAPNFSLDSIKGETLSLDSLKGKVVLVGMFRVGVQYRLPLDAGWEGCTTATTET